MQGFYIPISTENTQYRLDLIYLFKLPGHVIHKYWRFWIAFLVERKPGPDNHVQHSNEHRIFRGFYRFYRKSIDFCQNKHVSAHISYHFYRCPPSMPALVRLEDALK